MEYGLRHFVSNKCGVATLSSLNPCFNGIWSATHVCIAFLAIILCLNPCFNGIWSATFTVKDVKVVKAMVLILVLMEYGLRQHLS